MLGVCHLDLMLTARAPLDPRDNYSTHDASLPQLLQEGLCYALLIVLIFLFHIGILLCLWLCTTTYSPVLHWEFQIVSFYVTLQISVDTLA